MKKKIGFTLLSIATFVFATHSVNALTTYDYSDWNDGSGYGTATEVDDNITNIKGDSVPNGGMYQGPYSKASTAKLADGITEETYVMLDPDKFSNGELFEVTLGLKDANGEYVSEAVSMTQKIGDVFKVTTSWASNFSASVTRKGIYTYQWKMFIDGGKTYVKFTLSQGNREIASTGNIDFDTIVTSDTKNPIASQTDVSVKYLWFCNVQVANGVDVYTELPTVKLTFVDPTDDEDLVLDVYQYTSFTEDEVEDLKNDIDEAAQTEGYTFVGFYADEDYTTEMDLTTPFEQDTKVYIKVNKVATSTKTGVTSVANNPKTSDINLLAVISVFVVAVSGLVLVLRKRFAKSH